MASTYPRAHEPPRPLADGRPKRVILANAALARLWKAYPALEPRLERGAILKAADRLSSAAMSGLARDWIARLDLLLCDLRSSAGLTPLGRTLAYGQLVSAARNMIGMHRMWARHPEIDHVPFERPIIIVGQMRSGTTRIQRLLACDRRFRFTRFYESWAPLPRIASNRIVDDRIWRARLALIAARILDPGFQSVHPTSATAPDEEIGYFNMLMLPAAYEAQWRVPRFVNHCEAMDKTSVYLEFRHILKTIKWLRRDMDDRPWILKAPQYGEDLDAVLAAFPDARVIHVTRDERAVAASSASLVCQQIKLQSDRIEPRQIGREWLRKIALRTARTAETLSSTRLPAIEMRYADVEQDWRAAMGNIYEMLELPFEQEAEDRMKLFMLHSAARARHCYEPEEFGLSV